MEKIDISKFEADGYQVFENVVPPDVILEVRNFLSQQITETLEPAKREIGCSLDSDVVRVIGDIAAGRRGGVESLSKSTRDALSGHFSLEARLSQTLWKVPYSEKFQAILKALLASDDLYMHMPPTARYKVGQLDATCVAKELTLLAEPAGTEIPTGKPMLVSSDDDARSAERHAEWMHQVLRQGHQVSARVGIFGTSISGTWLASALGDRVHFFVDEDPNRIGRTHLGKPIYSPDQAPGDMEILMPMRPEVATVIAARLVPHQLKLAIPPVPKQVSK